MEEENVRKKRKRNLMLKRLNFGERSERQRELDLGHLVASCHRPLNNNRKCGKERGLGGRSCGRVRQDFTQIYFFRFNTGCVLLDSADIIKVASSSNYFYHDQWTMQQNERKRWRRRTNPLDWNNWTSRFPFSTNLLPRIEIDDGSLSPYLPPSPLSGVYCTSNSNQIG